MHIPNIDLVSFTDRVNFNFSKMDANVLEENEVNIRSFQGLGFAIKSHGKTGPVDLRATRIQSAVLTHVLVRKLDREKI